MSRYIDAYDLKDIEYINTGDFSTTRGIREWVDNAPTADVRENVHGEWIKTGRTNIYGGFEIECSVCHTKLMVSQSRWDIGENFCEVCGADMRKGETNGFNQETRCD